MSWSLDLVNELVAVLKDCGLTGDCVNIVPGCVPPEFAMEHCSDPLFITFSEGFIEDDRRTRPDLCGPDQQFVSIELWSRECSPVWDSAGTKDWDEVAATVAAAAEHRTKVIDTLGRWARASCADCGMSCWRISIGSWECADKQSTGCLQRVLRVRALRDWIG